jgi:hypothetical protein
MAFKTNLTDDQLPVFHANFLNVPCVNAPLGIMVEQFRAKKFPNVLAANKLGKMR